MCQDGRVEEWKRFRRWKCLRGEDAEVVAVGGGRGGIGGGYLSITAWFGMEER